MYGSVLTRISEEIDLSRKAERRYIRGHGIHSTRLESHRRRTKHDKDNGQETQGSTYVVTITHDATTERNCGIQPTSTQILLPIYLLYIQARGIVVLLTGSIS
jgi:hypothetical protein